MFMNNISEDADFNITPLHDFLCEYAASDILRAHMPGHGGSFIPAFPKGERRLFAHDITEVRGAGTLYENNHDVIFQSEAVAACIFGTAFTFYSCGGSTLSIQAMLLLAKSRGYRRVVASRYSHRSLTSAAVLLDLDLVWLYSLEYCNAVIRSGELSSCLSTLSSRSALSDVCVFATAVDYLGHTADIRGLRAVCDSFGGIPLLADNAHGAYSVFIGGTHPAVCGADFCADSAHKTLPALTGAAYLHISAENRFGVTRAEAKSAFALFATSSPSYLIMESLDLCNLHFYRDRSAVADTFTQVAVLKRDIAALGFDVCESDALRVVISCDGVRLAELLRQFRVEPEFADNGACVLMLGTLFRDFDKLLKSFMNISRVVDVKTLGGTEYSPFFGESDYPIYRIRDFYFTKKRQLPIDTVIAACDADEPFICAETPAVTPPCFPLCLPGDVLNREICERLARFGIDDICAAIL